MAIGDSFRPDSVGGLDEKARLKDEFAELGKEADKIDEDMQFLHEATKRFGPQRSGPEASSKAAMRMGQISQRRFEIKAKLKELGEEVE